MPLAVSNFILVKYQDRHTVKPRIDRFFFLKYQPNMVSRRQCRAVSTIKNSASKEEDPAETRKSSGATGSSFSTLVMSKCWLREGMNIRELLVFSE